MPPQDPSPFLEPQKPFEEMLAKLGLPVDPKWELLHTIGVPAETTVDPGKVPGALPEILRAVDFYGDALEEPAFRFEDPATGKIPVLSLQDGLTEEKLKDFLASLPPEVWPVLDWRINKKRFIERELPKNNLPIPGGVRPSLVFYTQALQNLLCQPLGKLEAWWSGTNPEKRMILAPSWSFLLDGRYLALLGGDPALSWAKVGVGPASGEGRKTPAELYRACRQNLWWQDEWLEHLTPLHLMTKGEAPAGDPVAKALCLQLANLCLLFTADRSEKRSGPRREGQGWFSLYEGGGERVTVEPLPPNDPAGEEVDGVAAFADLVGWGYGEGFVSDRLVFLQSAIAKALRGSLPEEGLGRLLKQAGSILENIGPDWKMFMEGKLSSFDSQIRALEDEVATTVQSFSAQISAMIKSLSDTVLAALAVLLGAFIAGLIKEELKPEILAVSLTAYLVYLLVFPLTYNMAERGQSYRSLVRQFEDRRIRFEAKLTKDKVNTIVDDHVKRSQIRFLFWFILIVGTYLAIAALLVLLWLLIPSRIDSVAYEAPSSRELSGTLAANEALRNARLVGEKRLEGAEDVAVDAAGRLYTGTADGRVVRIALGPDGREVFETYAETGGRPLGLRFGPAGKTLFVADADKGLLAVDEEGGVKVLAAKAGGVPFALTNDLDVAPDGTIYFSDASSRFGLDEYLYDLLEARPQGRLLVYTPPPQTSTAPGKEKKEEEGKVRILLDGLSFANGVALARDGSFVLVAETYRYRIRRYWLHGKQAGRTEPFLEDLPGFPDNLSRDPETGHFWVALYTVRNGQLDFLHPHPFLKNQLAKLPRFLWPKPDPYGLVLEIDEQGRILRSLHDPEGRRVRGVTSAERRGGNLYLGSLEGGIAVVALGKGAGTP